MTRDNKIMTNERTAEMYKLLGRYIAYSVVALAIIVGLCIWYDYIATQPKDILTVSTTALTCTSMIIMLAILVACVYRLGLCFLSLLSGQDWFPQSKESVKKNTNTEAENNESEVH